MHPGAEEQDAAPIPNHLGDLPDDTTRITVRRHATSPRCRSHEDTAQDSGVVPAWAMNGYRSTRARVRGQLTELFEHFDELAPSERE